MVPVVVWRSVVIVAVMMVKRVTAGSRGSDGDVEGAASSVVVDSG